MDSGIDKVTGPRRPVTLDEASFNFETVVETYLRVNSPDGYWPFQDEATGETIKLKFIRAIKRSVHASTEKLERGDAPIWVLRTEHPVGQYVGQVEMRQIGTGRTFNVDFTVDFSGDTWQVLKFELTPDEDPGKDAENQPQARAVPARPSAPAVQTKMVSGRLGRGYKQAKWGMSPEQVKKALTGDLALHSAPPEKDQTLFFDLGEGQKLVCNFFQGRFYQAAYSPIARDGNQKAAELILTGLEMKYGPGKEHDQYVDGQNRPLRVVKWNDGISQIELRMPGTMAAEQPLAQTASPPTPLGVPQSVPMAQKAEEEATYRSSSVLVLYTSIALNARRLRLAEEDNKRQERKNILKVQDNL